MSLALEQKKSDPRSAFLVFLVGLLFLVVGLPRVLPFRVELLLSLLLLLVSFVFFVRSKVYRPLPLGGAELFVVIYLLWCVLSTAWSVSRVETLFHSLVMFAVFFLSRRFSCLSVEFTGNLIAKTYVVVAVLCWVFLVVAPGSAVQQKGIWRLQGIVGHEQWLAILMGSGLIVFIGCQLSVLGDRPLRFLRRDVSIPALLMFATLLATQARAFTAGFILSVAILVVAFRGRKVKLSFAVAAMLVAVVVVVFFDFFFELVSRGEADETLTGRAMVWERTLDMAERAPWLGYGYATFIFEGFDNIWIGNYRAPHAHNSWLLAYFETGLVGSFLMSLAMVAICVQGINYQIALRRPSLSLSLTVFAAICGITGVVWGFKVTPLIALIFVFLAQERRSLKIHGLMKSRRPDVRAVNGER